LRIAVIPPISLLEEYGVLGDGYHLCLSNEVLSNTTYASFYRWRSEVIGDYVILDNSAHEQLQGQSLDALMQAADLVKPSEIVLPDRLFFGDDTVERSAEAADKLRQVFPGTKLMGVPQGRHPREWVNCLMGLSSFAKVDTIGISKDYEVWDGGLAKLVMTVLQWGYRPEQIHLLGWGRELWKLKELAGLVRGVDSAKPIVYAMEGIRLPDDLNEKNTPPYPKRKADFFESSGSRYTPGFPALARHNIDCFRRCAGGGDLRANGAGLPGHAAKGRTPTGAPNNQVS
jgi:hypothetical protein